MAFHEIKTAENAPVQEKVLAWVDSRFPLTSTIKAHLTEYYAPKKFKLLVFFWCIFHCRFSLANHHGYFLDDELQARCC